VKTLAFLLGLLALIAPTYLQAAPLCPYEETPSKRDCRLTAHDFGNCRRRERSSEENQHPTAKKATEVLPLVVSSRALGDWGLSWLGATDTDVNGDGVPDAIVEEYSGGTHGLLDSWFVSLGQPPEVYLTLENERDILIGR